MCRDSEKSSLHISSTEDVRWRRSMLGMESLEQMIGRKVEIATRKDDKPCLHSGILTDVVFAYIYLRSPDGSGVWIPKKSIANVKEVKSA